jgi:hypothetical protein
MKISPQVPDKDMQVWTQRKTIQHETGSTDDRKKDASIQPHEQRQNAKEKPTACLKKPKLAGPSSKSLMATRAGKRKF